MPVLAARETRGGSGGGISEEEDGEAMGSATASRSYGSAAV